MNSITINPDYLRALTLIASKDDTRPCFNGVLVDIRARETRYVATDRYRLAIIREAVQDNDADQVPAQLIVPRATCKAAKRHKNLLAVLHYDAAALPSTERGTADHDGDLPECRLGCLKDGAPLVFRPINDKFPDFARVIPDRVSGKPGAFNWQYLADFDAVARTAFRSKRSVALYQNGTDDCALVLVPGRNDFVGAIMPIRANDPASSPALPVWWTGRPDRASTHQRARQSKITGWRD